jgi:DNA-binding PadR family transcriptional regulator
MVLAAIEDAPRHGYDIAREIESRSSGVRRMTRQTARHV